MHHGLVFWSWSLRNEVNASSQPWLTGWLLLAPRVIALTRHSGSSLFAPPTHFSDIFFHPLWGIALHGGEFFSTASQGGRPEWWWRRIILEFGGKQTLFWRSEFRGEGGGRLVQRRSCCPFKRASCDLIKKEMKEAEWKEIGSGG